MLLGDKPYSFDRVFRLLISIIIGGAVVWLINYLSDVLIPFTIAFLMAYLLNPVVNRIQNRVRYRGLAVFVALGIVIVLICLAGWMIIPMIKQEIAHMSRLLRNVAQDTDFAHRAAQHLPAWLWESIQQLSKGDKIQNLMKLFKQDDILAILQAVGKKVLPGIWQVIHNTASFVVGLAGLFIIILYLVFMLLDYQRLKDECNEMIPRKWRRGVLEFFNDFNNAMNRYFRAQALVAFIVGMLFATGFELIGLPLGILLGLFIGLLNMVPYLQIIGLVPAGLLAVIGAIETGGSLWLMLGLTLSVFVVVQVIQDALLTPRIMGKITGLSPAMILLSISVWGKLLGMLGLIIALPVTCLLLAYYHRLISFAGQKENLKS